MIVKRLERVRRCIFISPRCAHSSSSDPPLSNTPPPPPSPSTSQSSPLSYPTHVPLTPLQRVAVAAASSIGALVNPRRADLVAAVGEATGAAALERMLNSMRATEEGRAVLLDRPRVTNAIMASCANLPDTSLGAAYYRFMAKRGFEADDRPPVRFIDNAELAYVVQRAREVHDFWHVLFGCNTTVLGELSLKAVEFIHTGLPMTALSVLGAQVKLPWEERQLLWTRYLPWAARTGAACRPLLSIYYERHLHRDLNELRNEWKIEVAPPRMPRAG